MLKHQKRILLLILALAILLPTQAAFGQDDAGDDLCADVLVAIEDGTAETSDLLACLEAIEESEALENLPELPVEEEPVPVEIVEEDTFPEGIPDELPEDPEEARNVIRQIVFAPITIARSVQEQAGWDSTFLDEVEDQLISGRDPFWQLRDDIMRGTGGRVDIGPVLEGFGRAFGNLIPDLPDFTQEDADAVEEQYSQ